jgi:predicted acyltransferase
MAAFLRWGGLLVLAGLAWSVRLPINRWLWTGSFTLVAAGVCLLLLGLCRAAELAGWQRPLRPFTVFGSNAIVVYLVSSLLAKALYFVQLSNGESLLGQINKTVFAPWLSPHNASLAWALAVTLAMYGLARFLHARNIFVKL